MPNRERLVYITKLQPQHVLARDLINSKGHLVLGKGTELTSSQIVRLRQLGLPHVWVQDPEEYQEQHKQVKQPEGKLSERTIYTYKSAVASVEQLFQLTKQEQTIDMQITETALNHLLEACGEETNFLNLMVNLRTFDEYTYQHSIGVGLLSSQIGTWLGLTEQDCRELLLAGVLHDIGNCLVDEQILMKPSKLTDEEFELIKSHTNYGHMLLLNSGVSERTARAALSHHERMDGSGYPNGLVGEEIDLFARIIAIADVFNAMTSDRVYRNAVSYYKVLDEVQQNSFGTLDAQIVSVFLQKMTTYFAGNVVTLNDGTMGTVVLIPIDRPTRPLIQTESGFLDLLTRPDLYIEQVQSV